MSRQDVKIVEFLHAFNHMIAAYGSIEGVFLVTTANAILPVDRDNSVNTDS